jgi:hypothetical protein
LRQDKKRNPKDPRESNKLWSSPDSRKECTTEGLFSGYSSPVSEASESHQ